MAEAICIQCGEAKGRPASRCRRCHFDPAGDGDALVASVYLSVWRFEGEDEQDRYSKQLDGFAVAISRGENVEFDPSEIARLRAQHAEVERGAYPAPRIVLGVLRLLLPALAVIGVLWFILHTLRAANGH